MLVSSRIEGGPSMLGRKDYTRGEFDRARTAAFFAELERRLLLAKS
jgi:hypothetical protein